MKKSTLIIFSLFFMNMFMAQGQQAIRITNQSTQKEVLIQENKRIIVKTNEDKKYSGRFQIDQNSIIIENERLELSDIHYLKRNPLFVSLVTTGLLVYGGALTLGFGVLIGVLVDSTAFLLTIPAAGMIYAGLKSPNFYKKYKAESQWTFEIVPLSK